MRTLAAGCLLLGLATTFTAFCSLHALGLAQDSATVPANVFTGDTLTPPTNPKGGGGATVTLNWTITSKTYASGYRVLRGTASGGPYSQIAQVTPRTTASYVDTPGNGIFYYVLRSYYQNWESVNSSEVAATAGLLNCASSSAVANPNNGDGNGYETTPANACADGGGYAEDANSGTGSSTSCTNTGKDRHQFYDYGLNIPSGATISGIEVRLDAYVTGTGASTRQICAELSWNGGTSWTAAKQLSSNLTTSETTYILGSAADNWGRSWTSSELANANFRLRLTDVASNTTTTFRLDWASLRVTYTAP